MFLVETIFLASKKQFFSVRYSWLWKKCFCHLETYIFTNTSFRLTQMNFLSSENSILLFRTLLKFWKFWRWKFFYEKPYSCSRKLIVCLVEVFFFPFFFDTPASENFFSSNGNVFLNKFFIPWRRISVLWKSFYLIQCIFFSASGSPLKLVETLFRLEVSDFLSTEKCFLLFRASFLQVETVTETSWNK